MTRVAGGCFLEMGSWVLVWDTAAGYVLASVGLLSFSSFSCTIISLALRLYFTKFIIRCLTPPLEPLAHAQTFKGRRYSHSISIDDPASPQKYNSLLMQ